MKQGSNGQKYQIFWSISAFRDKKLP
jgi:hypothetical protein